MTDEGPSADAVREVLEQAGSSGVRVADVQQAFGLSRKDRPWIRAALWELVERGDVRRGGRGRWYAAAAAEGIAADPGELAPGRLRILASGKGEVILDEEGAGTQGRRARVAETDLGAALDGDRVGVRCFDLGGDLRARVVRVLERGRTRLTGVVSRTKGGWELVPDDPRLPTRVVLAEPGSARKGESVVAAITGYPDEPGGAIVCRVTHRLGNPADPRSEVQKILVLEGVEEAFDDAVTAEVSAAPLPAPELTPGREDLRDLGLFTIDPGDARDFDDAVCVVPAADGWLLWVAVADVSHYVRPDTAVDRSAAARGLSTYLPDRAVHMLPARFAAGLCSLVPQEDRLAMVVRLEVDAEGEVGAARVMPALVRSRAALSYEDVAAVLAGEPASAAASAHAEEIAQLAALAQALQRARTRAGGLSFDLPEPKVVLDDDDPLRVRTIREVKPDAWVRRAYALIEACMVAANCAVGELCHERGLPVLWRNHPAPNPEKFASFLRLADGVGLDVPDHARADARTFQAVIRAIGAHPAGRYLTVFLLRALEQARYGASNVGHFALAAPFYVHFTSPIRRYPDLLVHRVVKAALAGEGLDVVADLDLSQLGEDCSEAEQRATRVEREVVEMYRAFYLRDRVGDEFLGRVCTIAPFGLFVQIRDPFVEGLLPTGTLAGDHFDLAQGGAVLRGQRSGRTYRLGQSLRVRLRDVSVGRRQLAFELAAGEDAPRRGRKAPGGRDDRRSGGRPGGRRPGPKRGGDKRGGGKRGGGKRGGGKRGGGKRGGGKRR